MQSAAHMPGILLAAMAILVSAGAGAASVEASDQAAFDQVIAATCDKSVVILGEASHGDGHSDAVKVALVEQLVSRCGFNGALFEASFYEFMPIGRDIRQGRSVSAAQVATAVGAVWKFDGEVQPLFDFLAQQVNARRIELGGLDFQAGGFEQPYSHDEMIAELTETLPVARRDSCRALYRSRIEGDPPEDTTARALDVALQACLASLDPQAPGNSAPAAEKSVQAAELVNLKAWLDASNQTPANLVRARDAMMAADALRFIDGLPKPAKVVIWAHNGHAARNTAALVDYGDNDNLGQALGRRFGNSLFSLAISARGGDYRWSWGENKSLPEPPPTSLEARDAHSKPGESTFLGARALQQAKESLSAVFGHTYQRARWGDAFDGVLVLDTEYPPHGTPAWRRPPD